MNTILLEQADGVGRIMPTGPIVLERELGRSEDNQEGVVAFLGKRKPAFTGR